MDDSVGAFLPDGRFEVAGAGGGPLAGLAFAAKDIIDVAGRLTGCGTPDWAARLISWMAPFTVGMPIGLP